MTTVTDEQVRELAATAIPYSLALLWWGAGRFQEGADTIEAAHQRRMVSLHENARFPRRSVTSTARRLLSLSNMSKPRVQETEAGARAT